MFETTATALGVCGAIGAIAGFVDSLAGGGGLLTLPTFLLMGLDPLEALATNKLQATCGSGTAAAVMLRHGLVRPAEHAASIALAFCAAVAGVFAVRYVGARTLDVIVPIALIAVCVYVVAAPRAGAVRDRARLSHAAYRATVVPLTGFYDGALGPGTGSFFSLSLIALRGDTIVEATAKAKLYNFATNLAAAGVFAAGGTARLPLAAAMGAGQILGATLGAGFVARGDTRLIRPLIVATSVLMLGRYLWGRFGG